MQIIPHISHLSFPLGSRMGPGDADSELAISPQPFPACPRVPPTISTPPSSANSPFSSFHPSSFSPTLLSASGAPAASSSLYSSTLMELAGNGEKVVHLFTWQMLLSKVEIIDYQRGSEIYGKCRNYSRKVRCKSEFNGQKY